MKIEPVDISTVDARKWFSELLNVTITTPQGGVFDVMMEGRDEQKYILRFSALADTVEANKVVIQPKAQLRLQALKVTEE